MFNALWDIALISFLTDVTQNVERGCQVVRLIPLFIMAFFLSYHYFIIAKTTEGSFFRKSLLLKIDAVRANV